MAKRGQRLVTAVLIAVSLALFAPAFSQAAVNFAPQGWQYGPYLSVAFEHVPALLVTGAAAILLGALLR